jgi:hypothetical protein
MRVDLDILIDWKGYCVHSQPKAQQASRCDIALTFLELTGLAVERRNRGSVEVSLTVTNVCHTEAHSRGLGGPPFRTSTSSKRGTFVMDS